MTFDPQRKIKYLRTCAPNKHSNEHGLLRTLIDIFIGRYLSLRWIDMSKSTFSHVATQVMRTPIMKTRLFKYIENFTPENWKKKSDKNWCFFHISALNIGCGYSLELPRPGDYNEYPQSMFWVEIRKIMFTHVNPSFTIYKWGLSGSKII